MKPQDRFADARHAKAFRDLNQAVALERTGLLAEAESAYAKVIENNPKYFDGLHLYGLFKFKRRQFSDAVRLIEKAHRVNPSSLNALNSLGVVYAHLKNYEQALDTFNKIIQRDENNIPALSNKAQCLNELGRFQETVDICNKILSLDKVALDAYLARGAALLELNDHERALASYQKIVAFNQRHELGWCGIGNALYRLKRYDESLTAYGKALSIKPDLENAWLGGGNVLFDLKRYDEAFAAYGKALSIKPDLENAWLGRGNVLFDLKRYDEAFAAYDKALSIRPDLAEAWVGRGNVFTDLARYDEAFAAYDKALALKPDLAAVYVGRSNTLYILTRNDEALNSLDRAIELDPIAPQAHYNRSVILLTLGKYAEAWEEYEWRKKLPRPHGNRTFAQPALPSLEAIEGATVFLHSEQGLGDSIHFCRYAKLVSDKGGKVVLEAPNPLFQLFESLDGLSQLIEVGQSVPPFDYHCSLMSLPRAFRTTLENVPNKVPYLFAERNKVKAWANKLGAKSKLRVGLVWSGGFRPNQPEVWAVNQRRNMPLAVFATFKDLDADFYSLQKGEPAVSEFKELLGSGWNGPAIIDWTDELNDFADTAALIQNLDLVISVDTSTAHLAGAMAKPVWLLNRFDTEWRWLPNSPWYPTIKLYRQKAAENWDDVIENVKTDLVSALHDRNFFS
jgi:tetratricopeptide (TPR) repeat protein